LRKSIKSWGLIALEKISTGQVVKAIILNGLGFVARPLYLFPQFFEDKAILSFIRASNKFVRIK
jgi:hypothetical protein